MAADTVILPDHPERSVGERPLPRCRVQTRGGTCMKLGLAYSADRLFKSTTTRALSRQYIATAKAPVKRSRRSSQKKFSDSKTRTSFATGAHSFGDFSAARNALAPRQR